MKRKPADQVLEEASMRLLKFSHRLEKFIAEKRIV